jgi:hypothetical protein
VGIELDGVAVMGLHVLLLSFVFLSFSRDASRRPKVAYVVILDGRCTRGWRFAGVVDAYSWRQHVFEIYSAAVAIDGMNPY